MYSVELYKKDGRVKGGWRLAEKYDTKYTNLAELESVLSVYDQNKYCWRIHDTYVDVVNSMNGEIVRERYDLPYHCSVASEAHFCN